MLLQENLSPHPFGRVVAAIEVEIQSFGVGCMLQFWS